jgi:aromatic amino acid aminotransferase I
VKRNRSHKKYFEQEKEREDKREPNNMAPPAAIEVEAVTDTTGVTLPDPLSAPIHSNEILGRRKKSGQQWGIAAPSDSKSFRFRSYEGMPKAKRWDRM